jgi:hypothetical protein
MPEAGFEPAILTSERLQTHALDRAVTWIGKHYFYGDKERQRYLNWASVTSFNIRFNL